jgi:hypothetical protein
MGKLEGMLQEGIPARAMRQLYQSLL